MPNTTTSDHTTRRRTIQSVDRAARILKVLASGPRRLGVTELAGRLGMSTPTVHGLLQTLQAHGFVEQDRDSDKYQLGAGLLQLGNSYLDLNELREPRCDIGAVRYEYDPDQDAALLAPLKLG